MRKINRGIGLYWILTIVFLGVSLIAGFYYPSKYIPGVHYISNLGGVEANPEGHSIWNVGIILIGLLFLYLIYYQNRKLIFKSRRARISLLILGECASIGFIFIGIFPEDHGILHIIPANIGLIGFSIYYCVMIFLLRDSRKTTFWEYLLFVLLVLLYLGLILRQWIPNSPIYVISLLQTVVPYEWGIFGCMWALKGIFSYHSDF